MDSQALITKLIQRQEFRTSIIQCEENQIVGAGAGSGKTYQLVQKYLYELFRLEALRPDRPGLGVEELVAITFTEKAALEMKERIRGKLKDLSAEYPDGDLLDILNRRMDGAYIGTIHGFCSRLLRENPGEAGVDPQFSIMEEVESSALLYEITRTILEESVRAAEPAVRTLVDGFGFEGAAYGNGLLDMLLDIYRTGRVFGADFSEMKQRHDAAVADLEPLFQDRVKAVHEAVSYFEAGGPPKAALSFFESWPLKRDSLKNLTLKSAALEDFKSVRELFELTGGNWGKGDAKTWRATLKQSLDDMRGMILDALSGEFIGYAQALLERVDQAYTGRKQDLSVLDFNDLELLALKLLRDYDDIANEYRERFKVILVDEFQDTNPVQFKVLSALTSPRDNRFFAVGDHKQSIYGFRGADVAIFNELYDDGASSALRAAPFTLRDCRRSTTSLIRDFFNPFFQFLMAGGADRPSFASRFSPERDVMGTHRGAVGCPVEALTFFDAPPRAADIRAAEARALARRILELVEAPGDGGGVLVFDENERPRRPQYRDIAILFRSLTHAQEYLETFRRYHIPHYLTRGRGFFQSQEIADMANFLAFINYPGEEIALTGILRSPLICVKDETILRLQIGLNGNGRLGDYFIGDHRDFPQTIDLEDYRKLDAFRAWFRDLYELRDRLLISELLEKTIEQSHVDAVYAGGVQGGQRLANIHKLIELARRFERSGARSVRDFVLYLRDLMERESQEAEAEIITEQDNVVRIMTVHQAKGLQFNIVIVADIQGGRIQPQRKPFIMLPDQSLTIKYPDLEAGELYGAYRWSSAQTLMRDMEVEELKRLLYVACTRARDHLILSGLYAPPPRSAGNTVWLKSLLDYLGVAADADDVPAVINGVLIKPGGAIPEPPQRGAVSMLETLDRLNRYDPNAPTPEPPEFHGRVLGERPASRPVGVFTTTDLNLFHHCPRRYFLEKILKLPPDLTGLPPEEEDVIEESEELPSKADKGTALHWVLERISFQADKGQIAALTDSALRLFGLELPAGERDTMTQALWRTLKLPLFKDLGPTEAQREYPFTLSLADEKQGYIIKGAIDLWIAGPQGNFVVDYKFAKPKPGLEHYYDLQLLIYGLAVSARAGQTAKAALLYLETDPPLLAERLEIRPHEREREVMNVCAALMEKERATLQRFGAPVFDIWERNPSFCAVAHCGYAPACDFPAREVS